MTAPHRFSPPFVLALMSAAMLAAPASAFAQPVGSGGTPSLYLQAARAPHHTEAWTLGATMPWKEWRYALWGGELGGYWDVYVSQWAADGLDGRFRTTLLGVTPGIRFTPDAGRSRWFVDAGIGATLADRRYVTPDKTFSTRFNFATHLGLGVALGAQRQHEWQLRLEHVSNAGLKEPNPGENFLQLRYALHY